MAEPGESSPRLFSNRFAGSVGPKGDGPDRDSCRCPEPRGRVRRVPVRFHGERQDTSCAGWVHLLALIDEAAADGRETFKPFVELSPPERRQIVSLPASIAKLPQVRHLVLYGSNLVRIPPQIGAMVNLEVFKPYTSHRLHWYPYELTRCVRLRDSTVSTRVLYGNYKLRSPFPKLRAVTTSGEADFAALDPRAWGSEAVSNCSVCDAPIDRHLHQAWISLRVATDVLPLLVNACSQDCLGTLPAPPPDYLPIAHRGGPDLEQPTAAWA